MKDNQPTWEQRRHALHGRKVRIGRSTRTILGTYSDIDGGIILTARYQGLRSWNLDAVTLMPKGKESLPHA